ncbi:uncharacterized protein EDB91DRAFT_1085036 [Suillus paluster]|uniref:uncharacterized protein n=1 Tax=Suillus paluster TaxID=48578 RepID=UPI001B87C583|nr:uncharacterized protein EDB91DRAFT_1085036 [Suillus paluster]KAG1731490.1 hypothetical protein EDB91DRAFT_1085036 [Suillus paluster]
MLGNIRQTGGPRYISYRQIGLGIGISTKYQVLGNIYQVPASTKFWAPSAEFQVPGIEYQVPKPGTRHSFRVSVLNAWNSMPRTRCLELGTRHFNLTQMTLITTFNFNLDLNIHVISRIVLWEKVAWIIRHHNVSGSWGKGSTIFEGVGSIPAIKSSKH